MIHVRIAVICLLFLSAAHAEAPRVSPPGRLPDDHRLGPLKDFNGYFPFVPCKSKEEWAVRAERLHRQLLVATGLWPMPAPTPPQAVVHGRVDRDGYTVEKVFLESFPGHFVTGNLYRPKGRSGRRLPAVLSPHGHWPNGRFYDAGEKELRKSIAQGAERFDPSGRYPLQARCVQLARMGCIVFHYDMVGYADSVQLAHACGRPSGDEHPRGLGLFQPAGRGPAADDHGPPDVQLDPGPGLAGRRDDVDPQRIGVTGASGGGTQTFILAAIDPRPAAAFPAVMVSTAMQGGCTCENASYLRIGTGNVEIAALIAPRPLGMTAADDWTKEIAAKGLPELQAHYRMLGVEDRRDGQAPAAIPAQLQLRQPRGDVRVLQQAPEAGPAGTDRGRRFQAAVGRRDERLGRGASQAACRRQVRAVAAAVDHGPERSADGRPDTEGQASLAKYREVVGGAVDILIGRGVPPPGVVKARTREESGNSAIWLQNRSTGEEVRARLFVPKPWNKQIVIWVSKDGGLNRPPASGFNGRHGTPGD